MYKGYPSLNGSPSLPAANVRWARLNIVVKPAYWNRDRVGDRVSIWGRKVYLMGFQGFVNCREFSQWGSVGTSQARRHRRHRVLRTYRVGRGRYFDGIMVCFTWPASGRRIAFLTVLWVEGVCELMCKRAACV